MASQIKVRRGLKVSLPTLSSGELGLATDTKEIFIGTPTGNVQLWGDGTPNTRSYVRASASNAQSIASSVSTKVILPTENTDQLSEYDPATGRVTVTKAGIYHVSAQIAYGTIDANVNVYLYIYVNGVQRHITVLIPTNTTNISIVIGADILLNANDYVELFTFHGSAASKSLIPDANFNFLTMTRIA